MAEGDIMKPRGRVRELILDMGDIQDLAGRALHIATGDRNPNLMDELLPTIEKIFEIALSARNDYEPIERKNIK